MTVPEKMISVEYDKVVFVVSGMRETVNSQKMR
jgi:hypothetical protein